VGLLSICEEGRSHGHSDSRITWILSGWPPEFGIACRARNEFLDFLSHHRRVEARGHTVSGTLQIPDHAQKTPLFRAGVVDPAIGKVKTWWLWDGEKEWKVGSISEEQRKLPIRGAWNDTLLVERIESDWLPEKDER